MDGIAQSAAQRYLSVNVYPSSSGWKAALLVRQAGRPYPRLVRTLGIVDLPSDVSGMAGAMRAAAEMLQQGASDLEQNRSA